MEQYDVHYHNCQLIMAQLHIVIVLKTAEANKYVTCAGVNEGYGDKLV